MLSLSLSLSLSHLSLSSLIHASLSLANFALSLSLSLSLSHYSRSAPSDLSFYLCSLLHHYPSLISLLFSLCDSDNDTINNVKAKISLVPFFLLVFLALVDNFMGRFDFVAWVWFDFMGGFDFVAWVWFNFFLYFSISKRVWIWFSGWLVWVFEQSYCWDFFGIFFV